MIILNQKEDHCNETSKIIRRADRVS